MIEPILKLVTMVMVIDNENGEDELELFRRIPAIMAEHLEDRAGVNLVVTVGKSSSKSNTKNELDEMSRHNVSAKEASVIANDTIREYNEIDEQEEVDRWILQLADQINGKWIRFHTIKLLVDMAAADKEIKKEELELIHNISNHWGLLEDALDFLFLITRTEWTCKKGNLIDTKKQTLYF